MTFLQAAFSGASKLAHLVLDEGAGVGTGDVGAGSGAGGITPGGNGAGRGALPPQDSHGFDQLHMPSVTASTSADTLASEMFAAWPNPNPGSAIRATGCLLSETVRSFVSTLLPPLQPFSLTIEQNSAATAHTAKPNKTTERVLEQTQARSPQRPPSPSSRLSSELLPPSSLLLLLHSSTSSRRRHAFSESQSLDSNLYTAIGLELALAGQRKGHE
mmetsp:Transcript_91296/g.229495  ORF Transcript_91296/g.229495 Transcript_91296/m.229495 type:complete len:216 (+) Transcript_91296:593-1240(+)